MGQIIKKIIQNIYLVNGVTMVTNLFLLNITPANKRCMLKFCFYLLTLIFFHCILLIHMQLVSHQRLCLWK